MTRTPGGKRPAARLEPGGTFVVQLRSDSDLRRRRLRGRVEHVMSGHSEHFTSLDRLLTFMARYAAPAGAEIESVTKEDPHEES